MAKRSFNFAAAGPRVSIGRVFAVALRALRRRFLVLIAGAAGAHVLASFVTTAVLYAILARPTEEIPRLVFVAIPLAGQLIALGFFAGFAARILADEQAGTPVGTRAAILTGLRRYPSVFAVLLIVVATIAAFILLAGAVYDALGSRSGPNYGFMVIACVIVGEILFLAAPAAALETRNPLAAVRRSHALTNDQFWRMGLLTALTGLIAVTPYLILTASQIMDALAGGIEPRGIGATLLSNLLASVIAQLALALLPAAALLELRRLRDGPPADTVAEVFD